MTTEITPGCGHAACAGEDECQLMDQPLGDAWRSQAVAELEQASEARVKRFANVGEVEIRTFTNAEGLPRKSPELRILGAGGEPDRIIELPNVATTLAIVSPNDVSRVKVTFFARFVQEIVEDA